MDSQRWESKSSSKVLYISLICVFQFGKKRLTFAVGFENVVLPKIKNTNDEDDEGFVRIWAGDAGCGRTAI